VDNLWITFKQSIKSVFPRDCAWL